MQNTPPSHVQSQIPSSIQQQRVQAVIDKEKQRDTMVGQLQALRQREQESDKVARDVEQRLRVSKVQAMQRVQTYQRREALRRIEEETRKTQELLAKRTQLQVFVCVRGVGPGFCTRKGATIVCSCCMLLSALPTQEERKKANMEASFQRQRVMEAMETLQRANTGTADVGRLLEHAHKS